MNVYNAKYIIMKKTSLLLILVLCTTLTFAQAKYIFYFIGDGMGFGVVSLTEDYLAAKDGRHGSKNLVFSNFPVAGFATTYSASNLVTCSSAAGTALACGNKTKNGVIGMNSEAKVSFKSIAQRFKDNGYKVGITTSVSIDHATPGAFYAHQASRSMYYEIVQDLAKSGFDFFSGGGFLQPNGKDQQQPSIFPMLEQGGYIITRSLADCKASTAQKNILLQPESKPQDAFPYVIDKSSDDYTLKQTTEIAIDKLNNSKGFFLMVEGGKIDWASHNNDAATAVGEVVDMSDAVQVALDFYKKYPKQTLIIVTADHETGGLGVGSGEDKLVGIMGISLQKISAEKLATRFNDPISYSELKGLLANEFNYTPSFDDEMWLKNLFAQNVEKKPQTDDTPCKVNNAWNTAKAIARKVSAQSGGSYNTFGHTGTMVPVYAIGTGSELFNGKMDNTDIPKKIAKAAKVAW